MKGVIYEKKIGGQREWTKGEVSESEIKVFPFLYFFLSARAKCLTWGTRHCDVSAFSVGTLSSKAFS